jgi:hypothetical protein
MIHRARRRSEELRRQLDEAQARNAAMLAKIEAERERQRTEYMLPENVEELPKQYDIDDPLLQEIEPGIVIKHRGPLGPRPVEEDE